MLGRAPSPQLSQPRRSQSRGITAGENKSSLARQVPNSPFLAACRQIFRRAAEILPSWLAPTQLPSPAG